MGSVFAAMLAVAVGLIAVVIVGVGITMFVHMFVHKQPRDSCILCRALLDGLGD